MNWIVVVNLAVFFASLVFFIIGLAFIYKPTWLVRINKVFRERIFNDNLILLQRRKKGVLFLLLFFIFLFWSYHRLATLDFLADSHIVSTDRLLYHSLQHLRSGRYPQVQSLCHRVLARDPRNAGALYQLGAVHFLMKDIETARKYWKKASEIDPDSENARSLKILVAGLNGLPLPETPR
ncbi:MAG: hypothetical protein A2902_02910 [Elusimicrobia bacterium RIFCSPLOWO2_01_FULL_64_13]|nr:MAG: hypothetical protein A2636_05110 [Elusimicrobia bacterium RIFCSPHIGHO2_01_FULL_64_10]OGR95664.1 MAG: hypothetical protein A2902_02910 [Elusimicrobia bacterium RIFCSPLOWO2_01_FULL_64_13]